MSPRRLPVVSGKAVLKALLGAGFTLRHISRSHHVLTHPGPPRRMVSVPVHGNKTLRAGTLAGILDEAGLTAEKFTELL